VRRKVTSKGAYRKGPKTQSQRSRKPFVEGKVRIKSQISFLLRPNSQDNGSGLYPNPHLSREIVVDPQEAGGGNAFQLIQLDPFMRMNQGFNSNEMIGDSVYARSLRLKCIVDFPYADEVIVRSFKMYLITGWVTQPLGATASTTPGRSDILPGNLHQHTINHLFEYFDNKNDPLEFHEKHRSNIKIENYTRIKPKWDGTVPITHVEKVAPGSSSKTAHGAPQSVQKNITWRINRKIHYELGAPAPTDDFTEVSDDSLLLQNYYPNQAWLPFAAFYFPDYEKMKNVNGDFTRSLNYRHNVAFYYSDS
jgi:hypothetical protein